MRKGETYMAFSKYVRLILAIAVMLCVMIPCFAQTDQGNNSNNTPPANTLATPPAETQPSAPTSTTPAAPAKKSEHWHIMPAFCEYLPTDSKTRDTFGNNWPSFGNRVYSKFEFHFDGIMRSNGNGHVYIFPVGVIWTTRPWSTKSTSPFLGASADLNIVNLKSNPDNIDSGWSVVPGGSVFAGIDVSRNLTLKAGYNLVPQVDSFVLSGFNFMAAVGF
jgi:hypothetical protein